MAVVGEAPVGAPEFVEICDVTLRDGEQSPGIVLDTEQKLTIAHALAEVGVGSIEAGFPIASEGDFDSVKAIAEEVQGPVIVALSRTAFGDIDRSWQAIQAAERPRIHTFIGTSPTHMEDKLRMTPAQVFDEAVRAVTHAKSMTPDVQFSPEDAMRSEFSFMRDVLQGVVESGATIINIPDTVGFTTPDEYRRTIERIRAEVAGDYVISTHCHRDLGMAVANSLEGIRGGARKVEGTVNSVGERAGNADWQTIAMALRVRPDYYGNFETGITSELLVPTSKLVADITGYPVPPNYPVVGDNAFAHEAGIHQGGVIRNRKTYEIMSAESVGRTSELVLGKHSGTAAVRVKMEQLGVNQTNAGEVRDGIKEFAERIGRSELTDTEVEDIIYEQRGEAVPAIYGFEAFQASSTEGSGSAAFTVIDRETGAQTQAEAVGNGEIDAAISAFCDVVPGYRFETWQPRAVGSGSSATAEVHCAVVSEADGTRVTAVGSHPNTVQATLQAFVRGVNCIENIKNRKADVTVEV